MLRVLVAEDNLVNQEVALGFFEALDCEVTMVDHGADAVQAYTTAAPGRFDLILMDCQMPVMDGYEATRQIRAWEQKGKVEGRNEIRHVPILALTAETAESCRAGCLDAGMDDMLAKPLRLQALSALLEQWRPCGRISEQRMVSEGREPRSADHAEPPGETVLQEEQLQALRALDPDGAKGLISRAIEKFLRYGDDLMIRMADSASKGDMVELSRLAHSLKSSSANLGAVEVAHHCQRIEATAGVSGTRAGMEEQIEALTGAYQAARQALSAVQDRER